MTATSDVPGSDDAPGDRAADLADAAVAPGGPDPGARLPVAALRAAVAQFEAPLLRYAARLTGNAEVARDVVQDTFLRLCAQPAAAVQTHLAEWLFTVCRHRALDHHRKEGRMQQPAISAPDAGADSLADGGKSAFAGASTSGAASADPHAVSERRESLARALVLLGTLPRNQQEVIRLKFQEGLSYKEISGVTQLTVSHVGVLIHNGLKTLRARMDLAPRLVPAGRPAGRKEHP
jgi:RNA polymerase sigma factor (sigma-70 family)